MKLIGKLIRYTLFLMIALSLFLSWKLWTNSGSKIEEQPVNKSEQIANMKQPKDVFLPVKLVYHDSKGDHYYSSKESLIQSMSKELFERMGDELPVEKSRKKIDPHLIKGSFDLSMSSSLSLAYYLKINEKEVPSHIKKDVTFRRILVSFSDNHIHFIDNENNQIYQTELLGDPSEVKDILRKEGNRFLPVDNPKMDLPVYYEFKNDITLKKYSYIVATQSYTMFSKAFFDDTQEVFSNDDHKASKNVSLMNAEGGTLDIMYDTGEVRFNSRFDSEKARDLGTDTIYEDTFFYLKNTGNALGTIRYFEGTPNRVTYRNYVEGYPIFSDNGKGRMDISRENKNIRISTNQETIQVPIPSEEEVVLESTDKIIEKLQLKGIDVKDIQGLQIGYTWEANQETKQVVDLVPEWYIKLKDKWESLSDVSKMLEKGVGE
ncbi:YycH family regulatory protein [Vagococcus fessus]|uniref:Regulatory protein YycH domain-containing protein n=1 Tax=Vagococcus fessus TaxID=120370 RepID=A0A430A8I1_9ENTE|nr:two-component system activity regulator YycH [Vagococcus fessus]RSU03430.1 hypothetical protein CBF31_06880 [Vagococcus fessus]